MGAETGGGGDQQKMLKVVTTKCSMAILSKENVEKQSCSVLALLVLCIVSDMGPKFGRLHATKCLALMFSSGVCQGLKIVIG